MLHTITLLLLSKGLFPLWVKCTVGLLISQICYRNSNTTGLRRLDLSQRSERHHLLTFIGNKESLEKICWKKFFRDNQYEGNGFFFVFFFVFFMLVLLRRTSFWPPFMVYISINGAHIFYRLHFFIVSLWGQLTCAASHFRERRERERETILTFSWLTLTILTFSTGRHPGQRLMIVDIHFYWCFHQALHK